MRRLALLFSLAPVLSFAAAEWRLVWADEFDSPGLPDSSKWTYEEGMVRNHELQYYTARIKENVRVEDGKLIIEARHEAGPKNATWTSGSITTQGKLMITDGRVEVRAKLPTGRGTWPAMWLLGANHRQAGWPRCGEIDIMENVGYDPEVIHANIHTELYNHVKKTGKGDKITVEKPWESFHVYALEWSHQKLDFFVDDHKYFTYENDGSGEGSWPFDKPQYLILNLAIGGGWGGRMGVDESISPQRFEIDYVRMYAPAPGSANSVTH